MQLDRKNVEILIIYQKEPHPGQMAFRDIFQPETLEQRFALAKKMKDDYEMPMTVLVDSMEDQSRELLSELPSPVFILNGEGMVTHKFPWPDHVQIADALDVELYHDQRKRHRVALE